MSRGRGCLWLGFFAIAILGGPALALLARALPLTMGDLAALFVGVLAVEAVLFALAAYPDDAARLKPTVHKWRRKRRPATRIEVRDASRDSR